MTTDLARFPYPSIHNLSAPTLVEAIDHDPVSSGFVVMTFRANDAEEFIIPIRQFAAETRRCAPSNRLLSIHAFRQIRRDELGGAVLYDRQICEALLDRAGPMQQIFLNNALANWLVLVEFETPEAALAFTEGLTAEQNEIKLLSNISSAQSFGAFRNMRQYARVLHDPDLIHFFNLFPGPGNLEVMWQAWQEATPWFFEIGEIRSSFPLLALRDDQPILLVNRGHWDSMKHFIHGAIYDQYLREHIMKGIYADRKVLAPQPFFCKIVPV